jgi:Cd2+/Zn2+-exporting ATPase
MIEITMEIQLTDPIQCEGDCRTIKPGFYNRYRDFLLSKDTIIAFINGVLLLAGFVFSLFRAAEIGRWLYFGSAVIGGIPLFMLASKAVFIKHDITAGFMASVAMIAAILVGEYSAAALVVFMFAIGDWLENLTIARANNALRDLAQLVPATVTVRRKGMETIIPVEQVTLEDIVLVRSGERIGVDGVLLSGYGCINQSAITGESMPIEKKSGDDIFAGTLNEMGAFEVKVTRLGQDTTLGQIVQLVKDAQAQQAPVQRLANKYAKILVPVTFSIAIAVFLLSGEIIRAITVLVVVCPCALVLATPTGVVAAIGNAAKRGMLVKSGAVIEQVGKVDVVAFDKTGTLTHGKPVVQDVICHNGMERDELLTLAASAERFSEHPIGRSIVQALEHRKLSLREPQEFNVLPGYGVTARIGEQQVVMGNRVLMIEKCIAWSNELNEQVQGLEIQGHTVIPVAVNGSIAGLIALADTARPEAKTAIAELKRMGIREVIMITGDNPRTAKRIADELGIDRYFAEVLPQQKLKIIRDLQMEGRKVMFAGDGVNDAPALAAADIGVAMGLAGTDVALETASIGLMADEIERLPQIIDLSRTALHVIRQNVIFSMSMNVISLLLGGFGIIGPAIGALLHEFSALPVLANSARLINYRPSK